MSTITIQDDAICHLDELYSELFPSLNAHPVKQSDPRAKGLVLQFTHKDAASALSGFPVLYDAVWPLLTADRSYILAANQTPPTCFNDFAMRPHVDKRWNGTGFSDDPPLWTTVIFLKFPSLSQGGELVLFENFDGEQMRLLDGMERKDGRVQVSALGAKVVIPKPGRLCRFPGNLPHAVLGYNETDDKTQRLSLVLAEFSN